jgi:hypothetical protein
MTVSGTHPREDDFVQEVIRRADKRGIGFMFSSDARKNHARERAIPDPITAEELDSLNANQLAYMMDRGDE